MSIITKSGSPIKGSPTLFTLSKSALAAVTMVAADSYFSQLSNWKYIELVYRSSIGKQKEIMKFNALLSSPTANFLVSLKAKDVFQIRKIVIKDFDGGSFEIPRSALNAAEFDVSLVSLNEDNYILLENLEELLFEDGTNAILD